MGLNEDGDWAKFTNATFIMLNEPGSIVNIEDAVNQYTSIQNQVNPEQQLRNE